jgi:hypothetical protein
VVAVTALWVQWVGREWKQAGKMKLGEKIIFGICKKGIDRRCV